LTGWNAEEALGRPLDRVFRLRGTGEASRVTPNGDADSERPGRELGELLTRESQAFPIEYAVSPSRDLGGRGTGLVVVFTNVTGLRLLELQLARVSTHDLLTGLLNRHAFLGHLERALQRRGEDDQQQLLFFLDIDQFQLVNDTCGHAAGDELLLWVAELLREVAGERDVIARLGGDEFALLVTRRTMDEGVRFAEQLQNRLQEYVFSWEDMSFSVSASLGVAPLSEGFASPAQLLSAADHACNMAKDKGRASLLIYQHDDAEMVQRRTEMDWMARINHYLENGTLHLYAQPIRPLSPMALRGLQFEVLLRMIESEGKVRTPGQLVKAAERYGLMTLVDRWVIRSTLRALDRMRSDGIHLLHLCFINLSALSLRDSTVIDCIRGQLAESGIPPHMLCFEITETAAVQNWEQTRWVIQELGSIGCHLALDDFGTGVASYSYLKELPVNYLKVDGSFVEAMPASPLDRAMVESINQISHMLGLETIAESVGNRDLYDHVRAIGIDHAQGYWIGLPRPFDEVCGLAGHA
jgi:Amt family ammonium transporter